MRELFTLMSPQEILENISAATSYLVDYCGLLHLADHIYSNKTKKVVIICPLYSIYKSCLNILFPYKFFQLPSLFCEYLQVHRGPVSDLIPPACPGSIPGSPPSWSCPENLHRE